MEHSSAPPRPNQDAHLTAHPRTSNIAGMSEGAPAASTRSSATLVEMERELTRLLLEYDELETAWPKCRHVLIRARAGRLAADALLRLAGLQHDIATTPARTLPEAAVQLRRLAALYEGCSNPLRRLLQARRRR